MVDPNSHCPLPQIDSLSHQFFESLALLEKKVKASSKTGNHERILCLVGENEVLRTENSRLKREISYQEMLQKRQEGHQEILGLEKKYFALEKSSREMEECHKTQHQAHEKMEESLLEELHQLNQKLEEKECDFDQIQEKLAKALDHYHDLKRSRDFSERAAKEVIQGLESNVKLMKAELLELKQKHSEEIRKLDQNHQKERLQYEEKLLQIGQNAKQSAWVKQKQIYENKIEELQGQLSHLNSGSEEVKIRESRKRTKAKVWQQQQPRKRLKSLAMTPPVEPQNEIVFD